MSFTSWQRIGRYEYEFGKDGYTGWFRATGGRMSSGQWPECNIYTGEVRNNEHPTTTDED